jgi:hypothetical protein
MSAKLEAVMVVQKAADEKTRRHLSANEALNIEIARLGQLEQFRNSSLLPLPRFLTSISRCHRHLHLEPTEFATAAVNLTTSFELSSRSQRSRSIIRHGAHAHRPAFVPRQRRHVALASRQRKLDIFHICIVNVGGCMLDCLLDSGSDATLVPTSLVDPADINRVPRTGPRYHVTHRPRHGTSRPVRTQHEISISKSFRSEATSRYLPKAAILFTHQQQPS